VMLQPMPPEALKALNIDHGVLIARVIEGQPGAKAGLKDGDVMVEFGGAKVADVASLRALVAAAKPGAKVPVKLVRDGKEMALDVTLGEQEGEGAAPAAPGEGGGENLDIGISVQTLTPDLANQFGFEGAKGVLVTAVDANGLAAKARPAPIARGDLITEINRTPVASVADARKAVADARKAREKTLLILVRAREGARYVVVDLGQ